MNVTTTRRSVSPGGRTPGSRGRRYPVLGITATIALLLQMLAPLLATPGWMTTFAEETPAAVESTPSDQAPPLQTTDVPEQPPADTTAPVVSVPASITVTADSATGMADVQFADQISATDEVDGVVPVTADPVPGPFPIGDTTVTVTATDAAGNIGTATFIVSVRPASEPTSAPPATEPEAAAPAPAVETESGVGAARAAVPDANIAAATVSGPVSIYYELWPMVVGTFDVEYRVYDNTTCTGDPSTIGTVTIGSSYYSSELLSNVIVSGQSIAVTAPSVTGYTFASWTQLQGGSATVASETLCQNADDVVDVSNITSWRGFYAVPSTSLTVDPVTAPYGGTATLRATLLTASGAPATSAGINFLIDGSVLTDVYGRTLTVSTNSAGIASVNYTLPKSLAIGDHTLSATWAGNASYPASTSNTTTLTIGLGSQMIYVTPATIPTKTYGALPFTVSANASSGLPVTVTGTVGVCTVQGSTVTIIGAGTCKLTFSQAGDANYLPAPNVVKTFTVNKAIATLTISASTLNQVYDGNPKPVTVTVSPTTVTGVLVTYDGSETPPADAGSYSVVASLANPNYTATNKTGTLVISKAPVTLTLGNLTHTYDGTPRSATVQTLPAGMEADVTLTYNGSTAAPVDAGSYSVVATLANANYSGTTTGTMVISPMRVTITPDSAQAKVYGEIDPVLTFTNDAGLPASAFIGALSRVNGENAGSYDITIGNLSAGGNYVLALVDAPVTFSITPRPITVTADSLTKVYGDNDPTLTFAVPTGTLAYDDVLSGSLARVPGENVGPHAVNAGDVITRNPNYDITFVAGNLEITPRPITVTAGDQVKTWGDPDPQLTYSVTAGNLVGTDEITGALDRDPGEEEGTYTITQGSLTAGTNYDLTFVNGTLTIKGKLTMVMAPVKEIQKGGSNLQIRFDLYRNGVEITSLATTDVTLTIEGENVTYSLTVSDTALRYDRKTGQWVYTWAIPKGSGVTYTVNGTVTSPGATDGSATPFVVRTK